MVLQFILTTVLMVSLGAILYVIARSLPRIKEDGRGQRKVSVLERWIASEIPERVDKTMNSFLGKSLRKLRVSLLRFDNSITETLKKIPALENGDKNNNGKIDFKEIKGSSNRNGASAKTAEAVEKTTEKK